MVRPERRVSLTGESPVRVSAGAPGSRPQSKEEIPKAERGVKSLEEREQGSGPQQAPVNAAASSDYQPKGVREGRAAHVTAKATDSSLGPERLLDLSGVGAVARFQSATWNRRDPTWQPSQAKAGRIRRDAESARSQEGVRGVRSTGEGAHHNALEGRDPALIELGRR
jgi:hypothetical protein